MRILALDDEKIALEGLVKSIKEAEPTAEVYKSAASKRPARPWNFSRRRPAILSFWISRCGASTE